MNVGKGWKLANRYEEALFVPPVGPKGGGIRIVWEARGKISAAQAKRLAAKGDAEVFDASGLTLPLTVRPLRAGDRIRPFGGAVAGNARDGAKKVKEILIDRKVPREERWGRPVVCDAEGAILWIPGVLRSDQAPVTPQTRKTALLRIRPAEWTGSGRVLK
jgi:tRNA(Ile)-lysidine synthase